MRSFNDFVSELDTTIANLNINSVEVQSLKILLANSLYLNELESLSIAIEGNPATCVNLNSAISLAAGKGFKVDRGRNPKFVLTNLRSTESRKVKKYDEFMSVQGYKLVYANDYEFLFGNTYTIEVIFTKQVNSGYFDKTSSVIVDISDSDISEDFSLFTISDNDSLTEVELLPGLNSTSESTEYHILTIPDFGVRLVNKNGFSDKLRFYYKYLPYLSEVGWNYSSSGTSVSDFIDIITNINRVPYFEIVGTLWDKDLFESNASNSDRISIPAGIERMEDRKKIYILSLLDCCGVIKSTTSLDDNCLRYLSEYVNKITSVINGSTVSIYYQLKDPRVKIPYNLLTDLSSFIKVTYFNSQISIDDSNFIPAEPMELPLEEGQQFVIQYKSNMDLTSTIIKSLRELQSNLLGGTFDLNLVSANVYNSSDEIRYVTISNNVIGFPTIDLGVNKYPKFINEDGTINNKLKLERI